MEKYLVFRLEKWQSVNVNVVPDKYKDAVQVIYRPPVFEDKLFPCFELVKEFYAYDILTDDYKGAKDWARQYSLDNKVRTVVIKGSVFGD